MKEENEVIGKDEYLKLKRSNDKKKAIIIVLAFAMVLMLLLLVLYYISGSIDKKNDSTSNTTVTATPEPTNNTTENYADWMDYILNQNITNIKFERKECDFDNNIYGELVKSETYTVEKLRTIFTKLNKYSLKRAYAGGSGGDDCGDKIVISYQKNGIEYSISIRPHNIENSGPNEQDNELWSVLGNMKMNEDKPDYCNDPDQICEPFYFFENPQSSLDDIIN